MLRLMATALLVLVSIFAASTTMARDTAVCGEVEDYFRELDALLFDEIKVFIANEEWLKDMERMTRKANATDSGLLTLSAEEMQPFIDIITVPGDVLLDFPEDEIPAVVQPLHESAMSYWLIMPAMMRSIGTGGVFAAMPFTEELESLEIENADALVELTNECPQLVAELEASAEADLEDLLNKPEELDLEALKDADAPEGFAFGIMTLPGDDLTDAEDPPARNQEIDYAGLDVVNSPVIKTRGTSGLSSGTGPIDFHTGVIVGDPNAPVTMHIFSDYQCHFCLQFHDESLPLIIEDFVRTGQVKLVYHDFPRLGTDPSIADPNDFEVEIRDPNNESSLAAQAAMCAGEQDKYLEMSNKLFGNYGGVQQGAFKHANLSRYAEDLELDVDAFNECIVSGRYIPALAESIAQGQSHGITAVPMFILDNGNGKPNVIQQTVEGYDLLKLQIQLAIDTAP